MSLSSLVGRLGGHIESRLDARLARIADDPDFGGLRESRADLQAYDAERAAGSGS
jgi:hypothetical protein